MDEPKKKEKYLFEPRDDGGFNVKFRKLADWPIGSVHLDHGYWRTSPDVGRRRNITEAADLLLLHFSSKRKR